MTHNKITKVWYRRLNKAWEITENNLQNPDPLIKELFAIVILDASKRRRLTGTLRCRHQIQGGGVNLTQNYRVTNLGRVVLIPPNCCHYLNELPSAPFKV